MHQFLRAIGFSKLRNLKETNRLLEDIVAHPTSRSITMVGADTSLVQLTREYGSSYGVSVIGEYDDQNRLSIEHYFPYIMGSSSQWEDSIVIEPHSDKEAYVGVSESPSLGIPLTFYLQNIADYVRTKWSNEYNRPLNQVSYGALASSGCILLGVDKNEEQQRQEANRSRLIAAAREGDEDAIESLTLEEIDLYSSVAKRSKKEDIYSIVDSYCIPYGYDCAQYSVMGVIRDIHFLKNPVTQEPLYQFLIDVNEILIDVMINTQDLLGEPMLGRRFKGNVWIQGYVNLP